MRKPLVRLCTIREELEGDAVSQISRRNNLQSLSAAALQLSYSNAYSVEDRKVSQSSYEMSIELNDETIGEAQHNMNQRYY